MDLEEIVSERIDVIETTAGQISEVLARLGVPNERCVTVRIEPDDWLTRARHDSRRPVVEAGLSDEDIDRLIEQARDEVDSQTR
jgi:hypothetical protein